MVVETSIGNAIECRSERFLAGWYTGSKEFSQAIDFLTECLFPSPTRPYELPWEQKTMWAIVFGIMLLVAITGNCIVLWIVTGHRSMRTVTNYFLLNLSIADLLMSSLNCIFNFIFMLNSDWPFGAFYCTVNNFMANVTVSTSVFTLVAISFDRYIAIVHPLKRRTSRRKCCLVVTMSLLFEYHDQKILQRKISYSLLYAMAGWKISHLYV
ncbi:hypothetical protein GQX74_013287 [Glossina fuscipes]|nr:hypothetical protein GQX74_013287 [Glossina fuscipes]